MLKRKYILPFSCVFMASIYPIVFLYTLNVGEAKLLETLLPSAIFLGVAALFYTGFYLFTKNKYISAITSATLILLCTNYVVVQDAVRSIFPQLKIWSILPICIFVVLHIAYFLYRFASGTTLAKICLLFAVLFTGLVLYNLIVATPKIITNVQLTIRASEQTDKQIDKNKNNMPNIYYIVLDEYCSLNAIQKYYNYNNSEFGNYLERLGFTMSYDSRNESYSSVVTTTNTLNLEYLFTHDNWNDFDIVMPKRINPKLFQMMQQNNYTIDIVSDNYKLIWGEFVSDFDKAFGDKKEGNHLSAGASNSLANILQAQSVFYFLKDDVAFFEGAALKQEVFNYLENYSVNPNSNNFLYMHILSPHAPFYFDQNGNIYGTTDDISWEDKKYYLNQYIYVTKVVKTAMKNIVAHDPDAIIVLQSDHSARQGLGDESSAIFDKFEILNAVYYQGQPLDDIKGQSGLNTLRIVLGKVLGIDLPVLEVPIVQ